jgi:hypothetical protein
VREWWKSTISVGVKKFIFSLLGRNLTEHPGVSAAQEIRMRDAKASGFVRLRGGCEHNLDVETRRDALLVAAKSQIPRKEKADD